MNSNSPYRGNLILQSTRSALCKPHALQIFTIFVFFKVDSVLYWVVHGYHQHLANFWIKFLPNVLCHFPFPTISAEKNSLFMGA